LLPSGASVTQESHTDTSQKSVIIKIPASTASTETVVLGAHLDSINRSDQSQAPGADDDASGVAALTEILRVIKAKNMLFKRNVELHAYAAEEVGLIGSADIAGKRKNAGSTIVSMLQLDMIGYSSILNDETIHIITTDTSPVLVRHLKDLISLYLGGTWKSGALSPGTSDHKSWTNQGYHAAFAFENPTDYNRALHTIEDLVGRLNFTLAARFTKLALAFLSHEAGYTAAVSDSATEWAAQQATSGDIRLAALTGSNGGDRLVASVSETAASVEFCKIVSGTEMGCQSMMTDTALATQKSGRAFFVSAEDIAIAENDIWRVSAYAADGKMIAMRRMRLRKN
jgi:leucyl aminopeptidase